MEKKTDGIVIRSVDYKENDKILTLLTADGGKTTMGIRGVRRSGAKLKFASEPFCFAEYVYSAGRDRNTVISASLYDGFYPLRENLAKYYAACAVAEVCNRIALSSDGGEMFFIAVEAIKGVCYADEKEALASFLLRALGYSGFSPDLSRCGSCGKNLSGRTYFDFNTGRFSCSSCAVGVAAREGTYDYLKKAAGLGYSPEVIAEDSPVRALRLLNVYMAEKFECDFPCMGECIKMF